MRIRSFLSLFAVLAVLMAPQAHAASYSFNIADYPSQEITQAVSPTLPYYGVEPQSFTIQGMLESRKEITFTYNLKGAVPASEFMVNTAFGPSGMPLAFAGVGGTSTVSTADGLIVATAALSADGTSGTASFLNKSSIGILISSLLTGLFGDGYYNVSWEIKAVPLPAALPLFGLGVASLVGYGARRRKAA